MTDAEAEKLGERARTPTDRPPTTNSRSRRARRRRRSRSRPRQRFWRPRTRSRARDLTVLRRTTVVRGGSVRRAETPTSERPSAERCDELVLAHPGIALDSTSLGLLHELGFRPVCLAPGLAVLAGALQVAARLSVAA